MATRNVVLLLASQLTAEQFPRLAPRFAEHGLELRMGEVPTLRSGGPGRDDGARQDSTGQDDVVGILAPPVSPMDAAGIATYPNLRVVATPSVGQDHIDVDAAAAHGVAVANAKGYNAQEVAEYTLAAILSLAKDLPRAGAATRAHIWDAGRTRALMLSDCTVGLVGFGDIARRVAVMVAGLGMRVVVWNRSPIDHFPEARGVERAETVEEAARAADVLSLHVPLTEQTRHLVDAALIAQMRPGAAVVNTGRGALVDTAALRDAVQSGHLRGAVVDVLAPEPPDWDAEPAADCDAILLTPHMAWLSEGSHHRGFDTAAAQIIDALTAS